MVMGPDLLITNQGNIKNPSNWKYKLHFYVYRYASFHIETHKTWRQVIMCISLDGLKGEVRDKNANLPITSRFRQNYLLWNKL